MTIRNRICTGLRAIVLALSLAACSGEVQIAQPQASDATLVSNMPVPLSFTATEPWRLVSATVDGADRMSAFSLQMGGPGQVSEASLSLRPGEHTLVVAADVGPTQNPAGVTRSTASVTFNVESPGVSLALPHFNPADDPELYASPVEVTVTANFDWPGLRVQRVTAPSNQLQTETLSFDGPSGRRDEPAVGRLVLPTGSHRLVVTAIDAAGAAFATEEIVRVTRGSAPLCNVSANCISPGHTHHPAVGTTLPPWCGGGKWAFVDASRDRCRSVDGAENETPERNRTVCETGTRRFVSGVATCINASPVLRDPPELATSTNNPAPRCGTEPECVDDNLSCEPNQRKDTSAAADGTCICVDCPTG